MEKKMTKYLSILAFVMMSSLAAQPGNYKTIEGFITYITMDQVYSDVGSVKGAEIGDTLTVFRRNDEVGLLVITNIARKSSVSHPLVPIDQFQLGDRISYEKFIVEPEKTPILTDTQGSNKTKKKSKIKRTEWGFDQNAIVSLRYSYNRFSEEQKNSRGIGTVQYRAGINTLLHSKILLYGRSDLRNQDFTIYQARAEFSDKTKKHLLQIGRVFPSDMSGVGATDGLLFSSKIKSNYSTGFLAGFQPDYQSLGWNSDVRKLGGFVKSQHKGNTYKLRTLFSFVSQHTGDKIDREFSYIKFTGSYRRKLNVSLYQTWDLYREQALYDRSKIEPTSSQISLRFHVFKPLTITTRFTSRRQVLYNASGNLLPDSLFVDELRTGWYSSIRFSHDKIGSIITGFNRRAQSESDIASTYIFMNYFSRSIRDALSVQFSASYLHNLIITGFRSRLGMNISTKHFGKFYGEYELYSFGYGNFYNDYLQHIFKINHSWSLSKSFYGSTSLDYLIDKDYTTMTAYLGLSYRL